MTNALWDQRFYVIGGTMPLDAPSYVRRAADEQLLNNLLRAEFCYVLNARQMGKSSLMVATAEALAARAVKVFQIDLTAVGQNVTLEQWYYGLAFHLLSQASAEEQLEEFWERHERTGPAQRWSLALTEILLRTVAGPVVVFVDEIDLVRSLPFRADEFFAGIRDLYNRRSLNGDLRRLTFCLLGVATPSELIGDPSTTPFNIGTRIELEDLRFEQAAVLAAAIDHGRDCMALLKRVFYWTDGHPYLTQRLCGALSENRDATTIRDVDAICRTLFLTHDGKSREDNLLFVGNQLLADGPFKAPLLKMYLRMLRMPQRTDRLDKALLSRLLLSGAVKVDRGLARVRNRLYRLAFSRDWVLQGMPDAERRRIRAAFWSGVVKTAAVSLVVCSALTALSVYGLRESKRALEQSKRANTALDALTSREASYEDLLYASSMQLAARYATESPPELGRARDVLEAVSRNVPTKRSFEWAHLWARCDPVTKHLVLKGGCRTFTMLDQDRVVCGNGDSLGVIELSSGRTLGSLHLGGIPYQVRKLDSNNVLVECGSETDIEQWNISTARMVRRIAFPAGTGGGYFDLSSDGNRLVVNLLNLSIRTRLLAMFDVRSGRRLLMLPRDLGPLPLCFVPGSHDVWFGQGGRIWELAETGAVTPVPLVIGRSPATALRFSPNGARFAVGSAEGVRVYRSNDLRPVASLEEAYAENMNFGGFSEDGARFLYTTRSGLLRQFDIAKSTARDFRSIPRDFYSPPIQFGSEVAALVDANSLEIWDTRQMPPRFDLKADGCVLRNISFASRGRILLAPDGVGSVRAWDVATGKGSPRAIPKSCRYYAESADGSTAVIASGAMATVRRTGREICRLHTGNANWMELNAQGTRLAVLNSGKEAQLYDVDNGILLTRTGDADRMVLSADGSALAVTTTRAASRLVPTRFAQHSLLLWQEDRGWHKLDIGSPGECTALALDSEGRRLAFYELSAAPALEVFDTLRQGVTLKVPRTLLDPRRIDALAFTPDGKGLTAGMDDGALAFLSAASLSLVVEFRADASRSSDAGVLSLSYAPDKTALAVGRRSGVLSVYRS